MKDNDQQSGQERDIWREEMMLKMDTMLKGQAHLTDIVKGMPSGTKDQKKGLIGLFDDHDERIEKLETRQMMFFAALFGAGAVSGWGIMSLLDKFF